MTDRTFRAVAPVSAICAAFAAQPSTYPPEAPKPDVAPTCGGVAETANAEEASLQAAFGGGTSRKRRAGESQGVVRAPRRSHLPAVRTVRGFRRGVVAGTKIAPMGSERQKAPLLQGKHRGCAQNWRKIGMANNKIKFPLWLTPECKQIVEDNYREDQCQSRSEFIEKAIWFYAGFLHTLEAGAYLPRALKQMLDGTLGVFAERIGRQLFKLAVEQNVNNHILASDTDIDAARY